MENNFLGRYTWQVIFSKNSHSTITSHTVFQNLATLHQEMKSISPALEPKSKLVTVTTMSLAEVLYVCNLGYIITSCQLQPGSLPPLSSLEQSHNAVMKPHSHLKGPYVGVLADRNR